MNFDDWTYKTENNLGTSKANAPMVAVINMGTKRYLHTVQLKSRAITNVNTTTGEVWASADMSNDEQFGEALTQNLKNGLPVEAIDGKWPLWRAKTWVKIGDFDLTPNEEDIKNEVTNTVRNISALGCPAKYLMIVVHEGAKGASGGTPDIAVSELVIKSYEPVNQ